MADPDICAAFRALAAERDHLQDRLQTLTNAALGLWYAGSVPYHPDRITLTAAQAHHAGRLAELEQLLQAVRER